MLHARVVTVWDFHGMKIVSENIMVSRYHGIKQSKQGFFFLVEQMFGSMFFIQIALIKNNQVNLIDYILV